MSNYHGEDGLVPYLLDLMSTVSSLYSQNTISCVYKLSIEWVIFLFNVDIT